MKRFLLLLFLIISCVQPQIAVHKKPGVDFAQYKKIAVMKFDCTNESVGQEVSDLISITLMQKGYDIAERSQLKAIIDENNIIQSGLTDKDITALKIRGVDVIMVGSVTRYDCEQSRHFVATQYGAASGTKNLCHTSLSMKMLSLQSGDILWAAQGSHSIKGTGMTAGKVLQRILQDMNEQIPTRNIVKK